MPSAYPDELKPDCNQSLRLITDLRLSLTLRLHGQVSSEPDVVSFHRADWSTWPGGRAKEGGGTMSVLMSGRRANSLVSTQDVNANSPRHHELEVLAEVAVRPFESCDSVARPSRPAGAACRRMGPDFFFPTSSVALV